MTTLDDLCEPWPDDAALALPDRPGPEVDVTPTMSDYAEHGYVIMPRLLDDDVIDAYCEAFVEQFPDRDRGFQYATPYRDHRFVMDLCMRPEITDTTAELVGEPMGLHLNLSDWRSTQRNWHQDGYLNPDANLDWYIAVWIALDDIDADAGPFEYVPGSHRRFGVIRNQKMRAALTAEEQGPAWPTHSERILTPIFEDAIAVERLDVHQFIAEKGDVLFWHPRLLHRGSAPNHPELERRALISHYSGIHHRPDFGPAVQHISGGWFFPVDDPGGGMKRGHA
jgi:hypothetical protein